MRNTTRWVSLGLVGVTLAIVGFAVRDPAPQSTPEPSSATGDTETTDTANPPVALKPEPVSDDTSPNSDRTDNFIEALAREMKDAFGSRIDDVAIQARLYNIRQDVMDRFPVNGLNDFNAAVRLAFAAHADGILTLMDRLDRYNDWLDRETAALMDLPVLERHGTLWAKRRELFGNDAEAIWADERLERERKQDEVQTILTDMNETDYGTLNETLHQLRTRLNTTLGEDVSQYGEANSVITQVFFGLDTVQAKLEQLPAEQRQDEIDAIRRQMGYSEEQIERLRDRDQTRNQRWDNGLAYMAERDAVTDQLEGEALQNAIHDLQERYFGAEAPTIRLEEENDFFRYERPRVYGRN